MSSRFPEWMNKKIPTGSKLYATEKIIKESGLNTVCQSALCPNRGECYGAGTATFMILGNNCTRACRFCAVSKGSPRPVDENEPEKLARTAARMGLKHVVITSVTRDDLPDGGAGHFAAVIKELHRHLPEAATEVLTPDFNGDQKAIDTVIAATPDIYNHNVETVPRLYSVVRPEADYRRSLNLLQYVKNANPNIYTKSGLMVGLGEKFEEVTAVLEDLRQVGCDLVTIGQYLKPSPAHLPVEEYIKPEVFAEYEKQAYDLGFLFVASGPYVRSSYKAHNFWTGRRNTI